MNEEEFKAWVDAFYQDHGYLPDHDPNGNLSPEEALASNLRAKEFGEAFMRDHGRPPNEYEYRDYYFGGWTPERVEAMFGSGRKRKSNKSSAPPRQMTGVRFRTPFSPYSMPPTQQPQLMIGTFVPPARRRYGY